MYTNLLIKVKLYIVHLNFSSNITDTGCSGKMCFFTIHCNPSFANIALRDLQSSQRIASVQHSYWLVIFCTTNSSRVLARERWQTFENSLKKNTIFDEHPVGYAMYSLCISPLKKAKYFNFNSYHSNRFKKRRWCLSKVHAKTIKHFFLHDIFFSGFQGGNRKVISHYRTCNLILEFPRI